jgi:KDO2-lipid IV(A) lauroyltransferase
VPDFAIRLYRRALSAFLRILDRFFHALPPRRLLWAGDFLGLAFYHLVPKKWRIARRNLDLAFGSGLDTASKEIIIRKMYRNLGRGFAEIICADRLDRRRARAIFTAEDIRKTDAAFAQGRGLLVLTAHFGNWGLLSTVFAAAGYPVNVLTKPVKDPVLDEFWRSRLSRTGLRLLTRDDAMNKMMRCLKNKEAVGFVLDQNRPADQGVFVDFFSRPACTISALAVLAMMTRSPVLPVFLLRDDADPVRHRILIGDVLSFEYPSDGSDAVEHNTQKYTRIIEDVVRKYPDQWIWLHRRWKTRPPGEPPLYP